MDRSIWILFPEKARKYAKNKNALFFVKTGQDIYYFCLLVRESWNGTLPPAFLSEKSGTKELDFFYEFVRLRLCRTNGHGFAKDKICYFCLLAREYCSGA